MPLTLPAASRVQTRFMGAAECFAVEGSPARSAAGTGCAEIPNWALDAGTDEGVRGDIGPWVGGTTFDLYIWLVTLGTTASNNVVMFCPIRSALNAATAVTAVGGSTTVAITGGTTGRLQRTLLNSGLAAPVSGAWTYGVIIRDADNGSDNYAGDIGFVGLEIVTLAPQ